MARDELQKDILDKLSKRQGGEVRFDTMSRVLYSTDASNYQIMPVGVVIPKTADDVSETVKIASEYDIPVLPRGGGTSLAGQTVGHALIIDFSKYMNRVLEVTPQKRTVRVQPGICLKQLNVTLADHKLMFGPDPSTASVATIGGVIGNNATGAHSILYGMAGDNLLSSELILDGGERICLGEEALERDSNGVKADLIGKIGNFRNKYLGAIRKDFPRHWRRASGYSLNYLNDEGFNPARLLAGAEGTLGVSTEYELNLVDVPEEKGLIVIEFGSLAESMEAVPEILKREPSAIELIDGTLIRITAEHPGYSRMAGFADKDAEALLVVEFYGQTKEEVRKKAEGLAIYLGEKKIGCGKSYALDDREQNNIWDVRRAGLGLLMSRRDRYKPITCIEDVSVPVETLPQYTKDISELVARAGTSAAFYGHASAGCLHIRPMVDIRGNDGIRIMKELTEGAFELAVKYGGVMSGEHGDGLQRSYLNERLFGRELYGAMKELKAAFDPAGRFNPGKIVDSREPDENLRLDGGSEKYELETHVDWSYENGFPNAVFMCNGQGACRKEGEGIMCPSYKATRDEKDTTRARANALRAYMSGMMPRDSETDSELFGVFDLCISCKACKPECPSSVDASKMKLEFMAGYRDKNGISIRDRALSRIHALSRLASAAPGVSNLMANNTVSRKLLEIAGIHPERSLPRLANQGLGQVLGKKHATGDSGDKRKVVLFTDTWASYYEPSVATSAISLLEAAGYDVIIPGSTGCCGRPMLSKGLVRKARKYARTLVSLLSGYARQGIPIVGTEPSCILSFRDEYLYLLPGEEDAAALASNAYLIQEFLYKELKENGLGISWLRGVQDVLYHGHCHERSLTGDEAAIGLLSASGCTVRTSGAGCCGMAGSFGYEKEHYGISQAIGEDRLFPAVRKQSEDTVITVSGFSCAHQIEHFTGRKTKHIVQVLASRINRGPQ